MRKSEIVSLSFSKRKKRVIVAHRKIMMRERERVCGCSCVCVCVHVCAGILLKELN